MENRKLAFPVRFAGGKYITVEADSDEEVAQCVEVICRTRAGERIERPSFGLRDFVFDRIQPGVASHSIERSVLESEPRASVLLDEDPSVISDMILGIGLTVEALQNG